MDVSARLWNAAPSLVPDGAMMPRVREITAGRYGRSQTVSRAISHGPGQDGNTGDTMTTLKNRTLTALIATMLLATASLVPACAAATDPQPGGAGGNGGLLVGPGGAGGSGGLLVGTGGAGGRPGTVTQPTPPVGPKPVEIAKPLNLGNLNVLKSLDQLFVNSRGGDQQIAPVLVTGGQIAGQTGKPAGPNLDPRNNPLPQGPTQGFNPLGAAAQGGQVAVPVAAQLGGLQNVINAQRGGTSQGELIQLQNTTNRFNKAAQDQTTTVKALGDKARSTIQTVK